MTPDPAAIRARNAAYLRILAENPHHAASMTCRVVCEDRAWALAEVDRLTLTVLPEAIARACHDCKDGAVDAERARILARVEALAPDGTKARDFAYALGWDNAIAAVIAAIEGETA